MFSRSAVDVGGEAVPPKLPESLDFNFWEVRIFLPENRFGGGENVHKGVERIFGHIKFPILF